MRKLALPLSKLFRVNNPKELYISKLFLGSIFIMFALISHTSQAQVSGTVFKDFDMNGIKGTASPNLEVGMAGVIVKATKPDGTALTVTYTGGGSATNNTGGYSVTGGVLGQIRLEVVMPDTYTYASNGAAGGTSVLFPSGATQDLAVNYPADYCQANPDLVTACYVNGRPSGAGNDVIVKHPYGASGQTSVNVYLAVADQIGSTWGLAYNKEAQIIYTSAFIKRHVALIDNNGDGKEDIGAIYTLTPTGSPALWLDLATLGVDVGLSVFPTIAARGLPLVKTTGSVDADVFDLVGKAGLGGIEISDDNKQLFVMNLYDKKVYTIDIATKTLVGSGIAVPSACTGGNARPFGLRYHRGKLYVGSICDAETSQAAADLKANLYRLDGGTFTNILTFPLNYVKGAAYTGLGMQWNPWKNSFYPFTGLLGQYPIFPQPLLVDIDFDVNEDIILAFDDRLGHQMGNQNRGTDPNDGTLYSGVIGGDILRASLVNGAYVIENNGTAGGITTAGAGNNEGIGGGEYYFEELYGNHHETVEGGTAILAGSGQIAVIAIDPYAIWSGGTLWMNNSTGAVDRKYEIVPSNESPATFGKANGLGDLEILCDNAPIEIGNRVWDDTDNDGIQDAGEAGISGVTVTLYASNGTTVVSTATTDANGNYFFSSATGTSTGSAKYGLNLSFKTNYVLSFPTTSGAKNLTLANGGSNDVLDSDADAAGKVTFTTGYAGENNHSFDAGYFETTCTTPTATAAATQPACTGTNAPNNGGITITGGTGLRYQYSSGATFNSGAAIPASITAIPAGGVITSTLSNTTSSYTVRIYDATDNTCFVDRVVAITAASCCPSPNCGTVTVQKN